MNPLPLKNGSPVQIDGFTGSLHIRTVEQSAIECNGSPTHAKERALLIGLPTAWTRATLSGTPSGPVIKQGDTVEIESLTYTSQILSKWTRSPLEFNLIKS